MIHASFSCPSFIVVVVIIIIIVILLLLLAVVVIVIVPSSRRAIPNLFSPHTGCFHCPALSLSSTDATGESLRLGLPNALVAVIDLGPAYMYSSFPCPAHNTYSTTFSMRHIASP